MGQRRAGARVRVRRGREIVFDGTDLTTTLVSDSTVTAAVPTAKRQSAGSLPITVVNPALEIGEKAVVYIQPWSNTSTTYTPPQTLRFKPE